MSKPKTKLPTSQLWALTKAEVCALLNVSLPTLDKWIEEGMRIETIKFNGYDTGKYNAEEVREALRARQTAEDIYKQNLIHIRQGGYLNGTK